MSKDGFSAHEASQTHQEATMRVVKAPKEYKNIGSSLSDNFTLEQSNNRNMLRKILTNIRYLGKFIIIQYPCF